METGYADGKGPPSPSYLKGSLVTGKSVWSSKVLERILYVFDLFIHQVS